MGVVMDTLGLMMVVRVVVVAQPPIQVGYQTSQVLLVQPLMVMLVSSVVLIRVKVVVVLVVLPLSLLVKRVVRVEWVVYFPTLRVTEQPPVMQHLLEVMVVTLLEVVAEVLGQVQMWMAEQAEQGEAEKVEAMVPLVVDQQPLV